MIYKGSISFMLLLILLNCTSTKNAKNVPARTPQEEVMNDILQVEKLLGNKDAVGVTNINDLICLTNIEPQHVEGNFLGDLYKIDKEIISLWKEWFNNHKNHLYFDFENIYNPYLENGKHVVYVKYGNIYRNDICEFDKKYLKTKE